MDNLSGEIYGSTRSALSANQRLRSAVQTRMAGLNAERQGAVASALMQSATASLASGSAALYDPAQRLWVSTWGYDGHTSGNRNSSRAEHSGAGVALGTDVHAGERLSLGLFFGYEDGKVKNGNTRDSRTDIEAYSLGGYASGEVGGVELKGGVVYSHLDLKTRRDVAVPGLAGRNKANYDGYRAQVFTEVAKAFEVGDAATLSPYLNVAQSWLHTDKAKERGTAAALTSRAQTDSVTQATLGVRPALRLPTETPVSLTANLGWAHAFGDTDGKTSNRFGEAGDRFRVEGAREDKNRALVGAGVEARIAPNATLGFGYDGQFGSKYKDHSGTLEFKLRF